MLVISCNLKSKLSDCYTKNFLCNFAFFNSQLFLWFSLFEIIVFSSSLIKDGLSHSNFFLIVSSFLNVFISVNENHFSKREIHILRYNKMTNDECDNLINELEIISPVHQIYLAPLCMSAIAIVISLLSAIASEKRAFLHYLTMTFSYAFVPVLVLLNVFVICLVVLSIITFKRKSVDYLINFYERILTNSRFNREILLASLHQRKDDLIKLKK